MEALYCGALRKLRGKRYRGYRALLILGAASNLALTLATVAQAQEVEIRRAVPSNGQAAAVILNPETANPDPLAASQPTPEPSQAAAIASPALATASDTTLIELPSTRAEDLQPEHRAVDTTLTAVDFTLGQPETALPLLDAETLAQVPTLVSPEDQDRPDRFFFSTVSGLSDPTALQSSMRRRAVRTPIKSTGIAIVASARQRLGGNSSLNLAVEGGEHILGFDFGYTTTRDPGEGGFGINIFNQRSWFPAFRGGDRDVDLPNGDTPWIHRLGGGVEAFLPFADGIESSLGVTYQRVSVRDDFFASEVFPTDEDGNAFTLENNGIDDLVTVSFALAADRRNDGAYSTNGSILRFGADQGFLIDTSDAFTRLSASYTSYIPLNLFGFREGPRTLVFLAQAGTMFGDVPPYEAFNIGGDNSVRGFSGGGIGTGSSFLQATLEYRFPIANLNLFSQDIDLRGALFVDYGTDLGTGDEVIGEPAIVRDKPGDGFGFGAGLQARLPIGFGRVEFAFTDNGDNRLIVTLGDRF